MTKLLHGLPDNNITESNNITEVNQYDVRSAVFSGMAAIRKLGPESFNKDILEQFGIKLSEAVEENNMVTKMITENNYNPLLIIHQLKEQNDLEGIENIRRAYDQFVEVVNSYCTDEMSQANADLIKNVAEIMEIAMKK